MKERPKEGLNHPPIRMLGVGWGLLRFIHGILKLRSQPEQEKASEKENLLACQAAR